jgi:TolB-like protein/tetratricopeptide (TPR) repeat protein
VAEGGGEEQTTGAHTSTPDVFVSYASQDKAIAEAIVELLEGNGRRCWIAPRDVTPGSHYADGIMSAISGAKALVLVMSSSALTSKHVGKEVERASSKGRPIIAIHTDAAPLTPAFEYFLSESQWIDVGAGGLAAVAAKLVEAVRLHLDTTVANEPRPPLDPSVPSRGLASPHTRWMLTTGVVVLSLALAYFAVDRLWLSKHNADEKPVAAMALAAIPAAAAAPEKSVAVLPFVDMSEKHDQEYFSDGLSEELIDKLTKVTDLRVPARTSSFYFKGKQATIADIAKALSVSHVLEGSVRKSGNLLRVTAQLIRTDNGYHVWSETYDRPLDDVFKVQDDIAGAVVNALKVSLLSPKANRNAPTTSTEAYTAYLQGRSIFLRGSTSAEMEKAADYLHRALKLDPVFALAWAELSFVRLWQVWYLPLEGAAEEARYAADRALAVDPTLPEAHMAVGRIRETLDWDWAGADKELRLALELSPMNARVLRSAADIPLVRGEFDKALPLYMRSKIQDPLDDITFARLAWMYYFMGQLADAEVTYRQALDLNPASPGSVAGAHLELAMVLLARGEPLRALSEMQRERSTFANQGLSIIYHAMGRKTESDSAMVAAEREQSKHTTPKYWNSGAVWMAYAHAYRGEVDQALAWLDRAYERRDFGLVYLKGLPLLRNLEDEPRYKGFLRKMNLSE